MATENQPAGEAEREKEVAEQMKYLVKSVARLNRTIEYLGPALSEVLHEPLTGTTDEDKAIKVLCPLANEIRNVRFGIEEMKDYVRDILKRLEV